MPFVTKARSRSCFAAPPYSFRDADHSRLTKIEPTPTVGKVDPHRHSTRPTTMPHGRIKRREQPNSCLVNSICPAIRAGDKCRIADVTCRRQIAPRHCQMLRTQMIAHYVNSDAAITSRNAKNAPLVQRGRTPRADDAIRESSAPQRRAASTGLPLATAPSPLCRGDLSAART